MDVMKVHPIVMARARVIAHNDHTRIKIVSSTEVMIVNYAGWKPALSPAPKGYPHVKRLS